MKETQAERPKRTIVGGRPRGRGSDRAGVPRGIEVLIKKASLDHAFCRLLLEQRAAAAREIGLELTSAETAILASVPEAQLQAMIDRTQVPDAQRRAFLGSLGAAMLSAVVAGCQPPTAIVQGIRPEKETTTPTIVIVEKGIRPEEMTRKAQPTRTPKATPTLNPSPTPAETEDQPTPEPQPTPPTVRGIRPDRP